MNTSLGARPKTLWHLWVVGIVSLLWFAGGANDYVMTKTQNMAYLGMAADSVGVPVERVIDYFSTWPLWADICWGFGVWGAIAGSLLLLLRSKYAFHALILSLIGLLGTTTYQYTSNMPEEFKSTFQLVFAVAIWISVILVAWYARRMTAAGILR